MKLATLKTDRGPRAVAITPDGYIDLNDGDANLPCCLKQFLALGPAGLAQAQAVVDGATPAAYQEDQFAPTIPEPQKVICVGLNYADHAAETGATVGEEPIIFNKFPTTIRGHLDNIELPPESDKVDYEAEMVAIIGTGGKSIPREKAYDAVAGYCVGHDVSARDWQMGKPGGQWLLGKTFDSFAPLGPILVTSDEVGDPNKLAIKLRINGETFQDSSTSQLIFPIDYLVSYLSRICTLMPGDLIFTGTPPGVGAARTPPVFLKPGDEVEVEIEKLGILRNPVVTAQ